MTKNSNPFQNYLDDIQNNISIKPPECLDTRENMIKVLDMLMASHERQKHDRYVNLLKCLRSSKSLFGELAIDYGVEK